MIFRFYSNYPFKNRADRVLDDFQKEALYYVEQNDYGIYHKRDTIDGKQVLRVAVADFMSDQACVDCHNNSPLKTWEEDSKWKLGDKRGVIEIIMPLDEELAANNEMRNKILGFIILLFGLLISYYSYMIIRREKELLDSNQILEQRVAQEVEKSLKQERTLIQQNKTATMGEMMSAIVHQWKQPLNIMSIANSSLQLDMMMDNINKENLQKQTDNIEKQIDHMNNTMNDFRSFFKPSQKSEFTIKQVVDDVIHLIGAIYKSNGVNIIANVDYDCKTSGYQSELSQVFINVLNNARDVIKDKDPDIKNISIEAFRKDDKIIIKIKDFAGGIPENIIQKIFEPYFTTKPDDKGTGIGLDMSKVIVEKVGGRIYAINENHELDGKQYKGATFIIELEAVL
jgi:C4-dicarboxylate-specific signal transduction histidine kinase